MPAKTKISSAYDVHPGVAMVHNVITSLKEKTGRSLDEWIKLVKKDAPVDEKKRREWLKNKYELGTNYAWWITECSLGKGEDGDPDLYLRRADDYVERMYSKSKAGLRPVYDALLKLGRSMGGDVKVCPCQTMVPFYRNHVFAQIKPATKTRIDLGLALKDTKTPARLIDTGGFEKKDRITHRIEIASVDEIDDEVKRWVKKAYEMDEADRKSPSAAKMAG